MTLSKPSPHSLSGASGDRIELLHTFVRIVEAGSLSAAAEQLAATQPTISRRLQALERQRAAMGKRAVPAGHVFTSDEGAPFTTTDEPLRSWWKPAVKASKVRTARRGGSLANCSDLFMC